MSDRRRRVLVVDDDAGLLDALPEMIGLRLENVSVDTCPSAMSAVEHLASAEYDAVISDIKMPIMDGLALLAECRRLQPDTPVLLITGHGEHDLSVQALRGGAFDFIAKPIDRDYFSAALNRAFDIRELRRTVASQARELATRANDLEREVAERTEELVRANRAKDDFLGMISHEMRTPLTVISGGLSVLRRRKHSLSSDDWEALMADVERESGRLSRMVEDLLILARAEGVTEINAEPLSLVPVAMKSAQALRERTQRVIDVSAPAGIPLAAGDPTFVERVVENLLSNAAKYSPPPQPIEIALSADNGRVLISVGDRGPGVAADELPLIFDNFYRSSSTAKVANGYGVGLAVCKRLVEAMSGTVSARIRAGGGLEVVVALPVYQAEDALSELEANASPAGPEGAPGTREGQAEPSLALEAT